MITPEQYLQRVVDEFHRYEGPFSVERLNSKVDIGRRSSPDGVYFDQDSQRIVPGGINIRSGFFNVEARVEYPITRGESFDIREDLAAVQPIGVIRYPGSPVLKAEFDLNGETVSRVKTSQVRLENRLVDYAIDRQ